MRVDYITFAARSDRSQYMARTFGEILAGRVLDIGCDEAVLKDLIAEIDYVGVDIGGKPDIKLNLEEIDRLPFDDASFDCVICIDVLEHLNNLHSVFHEMIRVTRKYLILSFPNCWCGARVPLQRGRGSFAFYGLPPEPPPDRHKWFFNLSEAKAFIEHHASALPVSIFAMHATEKPRAALLQGLRRVRYPSQERYLNRYAHTLWVVLAIEGGS